MDLGGGSKKHGDIFFDEINNNKFWLLNHFVPSHDLEPLINIKYKEMFQYDLLYSIMKISLKIPPHTEEHNIELDIIKKKANNEDYDYTSDGIRI